MDEGGGAFTASAPSSINGKETSTDLATRPSTLLPREVDGVKLL